MRCIPRARTHDVFGLAADAGSYEEWPLMPAEVDPQVALSHNAAPQPFYLTVDHDTLLAALSGAAAVEFHDCAVRELSLSPGDYLYIPAGLAHRIVPLSPSVHLRFTGREQHAERASFRCRCGEELSSTGWHTGPTLRQEGYAMALDAYLADANACPSCQEPAPAVDADFRWADVAQALRQRGDGDATIDAISRERAVPRGVRPRPPVKANAFWAGHLMTTQSAPLFPELGPGAMVPCVSLVYGNERPFTGRFFHRNTVDELSLVLGAHGGKARPGTLRVGDRTHAVQNNLPDPHDPEQYAIVVIVQRQSPTAPQAERFLLRCNACNAPLLERDVEFSPPTTHPLPGFDTLLLAAAAIDDFNRDVSARTCGSCGVVNPCFDLEHWGWNRYAERLRVANGALQSALDAAAALS